MFTSLSSATLLALLQQFREEDAAFLARTRHIRRVKPRTHEVLRSIDRLTKTQGQPPTLRDLMRANEFASTSSVAWHIEQLVSLGLVTRQPRRPRSLILTQAGRSFLDTSGTFPRFPDAPMR